MEHTDEVCRRRCPTKRAVKTYVAKVDISGLKSDPISSGENRPGTVGENLGPDGSRDAPRGMYGPREDGGPVRVRRGWWVPRKRGTPLEITTDKTLCGRLGKGVRVRGSVKKETLGCDGIPRTDMFKYRGRRTSRQGERTQPKVFSSRTLSLDQYSVNSSPEDPLYVFPPSFCPLLPLSRSYLGSISDLPGLVPPRRCI